LALTAFIMLGKAGAASSEVWHPAIDLKPKRTKQMNAALRVEPVETSRLMPVITLEAAFATDSFEVPIQPGQIQSAQRPPESNSSTSAAFNLLVTSRLTATETLCVRKTLIPS
jgi:hypothetical protein